MPKVERDDPLPQPFGWFAQREFLLPYDERLVVCAQFHNRVKTVITEAGITVLQSDYRAKTNVSIKDKLKRRLSARYDRPIPDIYGARFILEEKDARPALGVILGSFTDEDRFPYHLPTVRDLTDPNTPRTRFSDICYQAIHVYVAFGEAEVPNIGEVKLMTPRQFEADNQTREAYRRRTGKWRPEP